MLVSLKASCLFIARSPPRHDALSSEGGGETRRKSKEWGHVEKGKASKKLVCAFVSLSLRGNEYEIEQKVLLQTKTFFIFLGPWLKKIFLYNLLLFMKHWQRHIATVKEMAALLWRRKFNKGQREKESSFLTPQWDSLSVISIMFKLPNHPSQGQIKNGSLHCGPVRSFTSPVSGRPLDHIYKVEMKSQGHTGTLYLNVIFHMSSVWINRQ